MTGTDRFESAWEYRKFVEMLALNGAKMDATPERIAKVAISAIDNAGGEVALLHSAEPFVDDPVRQTRVFPKDVIMMHPSSDWSDSRRAESLRDLAVELLASEIESAMRLQQQKADQ